MYESYINLLRKELIKNGDPKTKAWWENYVKGSAPILGVKMATVRSIVHDWHRAFVAGNLGSEQQVDLAMALFRGEYTEDKLAGTLFLQEILLPADAVLCARESERFAELFTEGLIYDWNVCDWFCIKVLGPLIKKDGLGCAQTVSEWRNVENLWQARASLVAFVPVADKADYYPLVARSCQVVTRREERFAKTAVGWILRDISKHDRAFVEQVINENIRYFSRESLKNATKYFGKEEIAAYLLLMKDAQASQDNHPTA